MDHIIDILHILSITYAGNLKIEKKRINNVLNICGINEV